MIEREIQGFIACADFLCSKLGGNAQYLSSELRVSLGKLYQLIWLFKEASSCEVHNRAVKRIRSLDWDTLRPCGCFDVWMGHGEEQEQGQKEIFLTSSQPTDASYSFTPLAPGDFCKLETYSEENPDSHLPARGNQPILPLQPARPFAWLRKQRNASKQAGWQSGPNLWPF